MREDCQSTQPHWEKRYKDPNGPKFIFIVLIRALNVKEERKKKTRTRGTIRQFWFGCYLVDGALNFSTR